MQHNISRKLNSLARLISGFSHSLLIKPAAAITVSSFHRNRPSAIKIKHFNVLVGLNRVLAREGDVLASNAMTHVATPLFPGNAALSESGKSGVAGMRHLFQSKVMYWPGIASKQWLIEGNAIQCGNSLLSAEIGYAFYRNVQSKIPGRYIFSEGGSPRIKELLLSFVAKMRSFSYISLPKHTTELPEDSL